MWMFKNTGSYDRVAEKGRWANVQTARLYIDEAVADVNRHSIPPEGEARLQVDASVLEHALLKLL